MKRRDFIRNALGFAALTAVGVPVAADAVSRFEDMIGKGLIEGETFYLSRPIVIDGQTGLTIRNCKFIALPEFDGESMIEFKDCNGCVIDGGLIQMGGSAKYGVRVESGCDHFTVDSVSLMGKAKHRTCIPSGYQVV